MARAVLLILFGAVAGFGAAALRFSVGEPSSTAALYPASAPDEPVDRIFERPEKLAVAALFDMKVAALEAADALTDALDLEWAIEAAAAELPSTARDLRIAALLRRLAETDPREGLALAERLALGDRILSMVLKAWAALDPDAALAELRVERPPVTRRALALALLETFGADEAGTQRIAAALPWAEARSFTIAAIGKRAEHDLAGALDAAQAFQGGTPVAASAVAETAARTDPLLGMVLSSRIVSAPLRKRFRERLLDEWAKLDPEAMLAFLETGDISEMTLAIFSFEAAATAAPERLLAIVDRFGPSQRAVVQSAAVQALSALDPVTAYDRVRTLPPGSERDAVIARAAVQFVDEDPATALAWAKSLGPRSSSAMSSVIRRLAAIDPLLATDAVIAEIVDPVAAQSGEMPTLAPVFAGSPDAAALAQIASKVAAHPDPRVSRLVTDVLDRWLQSDARGAADWALRSSAPLTPQLMSMLAQALGPDDARQALSRVPEEMRGAWIAGIASGMGRRDLSAATAFIERYRDEPWYERARAAALYGAASRQPLDVARALERDPVLLSRLAPSLVIAWSASDVLAAARWVTTVNGMDDDTRAQTVGAVVTGWVASDRDAATRWVLDMPRGALRDEGLKALLRGAPTQGDSPLFAAFSDATAREVAVLGAVATLGRTNPALARSLIEEHVQNPEMRRQAERNLESAQRQRGNVSGASQSLLTF